MAVPGQARLGGIRARAESARGDARLGQSSENVARIRVLLLSVPAAHSGVANRAGRRRFCELDLFSCPPRIRLVRLPPAHLQLIVLGSLALAGCGGAIHEPNNQGARVSTRAEVTSRAGGGGEQSDFYFTPATFREGNKMVLPVAFPDGTRAELVYPPQLGIAKLAVRPYGSAWLRGKSPSPLRSDVVGRDFWIFYGALDEVLRFVGGKSPLLLATYKGADGQTVGFWDLRSNRELPDYLGFQFGRWAVLVYDYAGAAAMTDAERASWAANFSGRETDDGFLLLEGSDRLRLARVGEHAGPQLDFGMGVVPQRSLSLYPGSCGPHRDQTRLVQGKLVQWRGGFADWCLSESMRIQATGADEFIAALIRHLGVRDVDLVETAEGPGVAHG